MNAALRTVLLRLGAQEVARTNAAQASVRLMHHRRQVDDVNAYLSEQLQHPTPQQAAPADTRTPTRTG